MGDDAEAMAGQLLWVAANREEARAQAMRGREYVCRQWNRGKAFEDLRRVLETVVAERALAGGRGAHASV